MDEKTATDAATSKRRLPSAPEPLSQYIAPLATAPMNYIVEAELLPQLDYFFQKVVDEKENTILDGVRVFEVKERFLPGKVALGFSYLLINTPPNDTNFTKYLDGYRAIADMTVSDNVETLGIYYYLSALVKLKKAHLLHKAISAPTLELLKAKLDWRTFVNETTYKLNGKATNFYGVGFSIARLRMLLGWEDEEPSLKLLDRMLNHYTTYSGTYGFSDETEGMGRFDRYSILLIGEICQRFIETGMTVTPQLKTLLRNSAEVVLGIANISGDGLKMGRSTDAYGDTAALEILSAAAYLGILSEEEKIYAYAYTTRVVARYSDFWYDQEMRSVNLWEKGRRTDGYRGKDRILGENLSLLHFMIYTNNLWNDIDFKNEAPKTDLQSWLDRTQPPFHLTWFAKAEYERALITVRDLGHVFMLPIVNGASVQHGTNAYFPIPFCSRVISGSPDSTYPQLLAQFSLEDGTELLPVSFTRKISTEQQGDTTLVRYEMEEFDRLGAKTPIKDGRITLKTEYAFTSGCITRTDVYTPVIPLEVKKIAMEFATYSERPTQSDNVVQFEEGYVTSFEVSGLQIFQIDNVTNTPDYGTSCGALRTRVQCQLEKFTLATPLTIQWVLKYQS